MGISTKTIAERFWPKVQRGDGCWLWTAAVHRNGYGKFNIGGKIVLAHRVAWALSVGAVPEGTYVCHRCDNPQCVRPDHLFLGTATDNSEDMANKGRSTVGPMKEESDYHRPKRVEGQRQTANMPRGVQCPWAKLTEDNVREIRKRYSMERITQRALAIEFGVSLMTINDIIHRRRWAHLS